MANDPFAGIIELLHSRQQTHGCHITEGEIVGVAPLTIRAAGLELDEDDIQRVATAAVPVEYAQSDRVLLLTLDHQKFYIIGRLL